MKKAEFLNLENGDSVECKTTRLIGKVEIKDGKKTAVIRVSLLEGEKWNLLYKAPVSE